MTESERRNRKKWKQGGRTLMKNAKVEIATARQLFEAAGMLPEFQAVLRSIEVDLDEADQLIHMLDTGEEVDMFDEYHYKNGNKMGLNQ